MHICDMHICDMHCADRAASNEFWASILRCRQIRIFWPWGWGQAGLPKLQGRFDYPQLQWCKCFTSPDRSGTDREPCSWSCSKQSLGERAFSNSHLQLSQSWFGEKKLFLPPSTSSLEARKLWWPQHVAKYIVYKLLTSRDSCAEWRLGWKCELGTGSHARWERADGKPILPNLCNPLSRVPSASLCTWTPIVTHTHLLDLLAVLIEGWQSTSNLLWACSHSTGRHEGTGRRRRKPSTTIICRLWVQRRQAVDIVFSKSQIGGKTS